jgi:hypothetical protein
LSFDQYRFIDNTRLASHVTTAFNTIDEHIYSTEGCKTLPFFNEIEINVSLDLLDLPGFERQKAAMNGSHISIEARSLIQDKTGRVIKDHFPKVSRPVRIKSKSSY